MTRPDPTSAEAVRLLHVRPVPPEELAQAPPRLRGPAAHAAARARGAVRDAVRRRLAQAQQRVAARIQPRLQRMVDEALDEALEADPSLHQVRELSARGALDETRVRARDDAVQVALVNLELLKGEFRHLQDVLDELGMALAPATGLTGAGARFAELRETVYALERRLRTGGAPAARPATAAMTATAPDPVPGERVEPRPGTLSSASFDYVGFERRFRGAPEEILADLADRYGELLAGHQPVVDIGCGRGELLGLLRERGVDVLGVEPDPEMAAEARARGIPVHEGRAGDWLRSVPDRSLGSVITTHVLEHLELDDLVELLELAAVKLGPDSVFISETPNPTSLIVLGNSYLLDPTHVRPLHPSLLAFLCEKAGFRDVRLQFYSPAVDYHLPRVSLAGLDDVPAWAQNLASAVDAGFSRLNDVLFGPQDYAVVARTPPSDAP